MTISSISSSTYAVNQMATMRNRATPNTTEQSKAKEKPDLAQLFSKLDTDGSGSLDQTEVQNLTEKMSKATGVSVDLAKFMTTYDADGNGVLSQEETTTALEANRPEGPPPQGMMGGMEAAQGSGPDFSKMFSKLDADSSGSLDATETASLADMISKATGTTTKAADLIKTYDTNGDGVLSEEETTTALEANRPEGPPSPPENTANQADASDALTTAAIDNYLKMAALGMGQGQGSNDWLSMFGGSLSNIA